ncbi:vegetative cell wall protein gp1-like [Miscanthus floridulus]|uniref:vegetative cell wall protein gp1-like n=1 Tax=Miscanthus floridulus TaxID=154761 RepID=UPI00345AED9A
MGPKPKSARQPKFPIEILSKKIPDRNHISLPTRPLAAGPHASTTAAAHPDAARAGCPEPGRPAHPGHPAPPPPPPRTPPPCARHCAPGRHEPGRPARPTTTRAPRSPCASTTAAVYPATACPPLRAWAPRAPHCPTLDRPACPAAPPARRLTTPSGGRGRALPPFPVSVEQGEVVRPGRPFGGPPLAGLPTPTPAPRPPPSVAAVGGEEAEGEEYVGGDPEDSDRLCQRRGSACTASPRHCIDSPLPR